MSRPTHRSVRTGAARTTGLFVAGGVALVSAGVLGGIILRSSPPKRAAPPVVTLQEPTQTGRGLRVEMADKNDPTRRAMLIRSKTIEPLRGADYAVTEPSAWIYFRDGRSAFLKANSGSFTLPRQDQAPERGWLAGDVRVRLFSAEQGVPENPVTAVPTASLTLDRLDFDLTLGEAWSESAFLGSIDATGFAGTGFRLVLDEPRQQIQRLTIDRDFKVVVRESKNGQPANQGSPAGAGGPAVTTKPVETLYKLEGAGPVKLAGGGRSLDADGIEVFARLVDNKLRPGAVGELAIASGPKAADGASNTPPANKPSDVPGELLTVTVAGRVNLTPTPVTNELKDDDLYLRVRGKSRALAFEDTASKAKATGVVMEYGATRRSFAVAGTADAPAEVTQPGRGTLAGLRVSAELPTGVTQVRGAGALRDAEGRRGVSWTEQADFIFATERGTMTDKIKEAILAGGVIAKDRDSALSADTVRASFVLDGAGRPQFARVSADGKVRVTDGKKSAGQADKLSATFKPAASGPSQLSAVTLAGAARVSEDKTVLNGDLIEADLARGSKGETIATRVAANGDVKFDNGEGVHASTQRLTADPVAKTALLTGAGSSVSRDQSRVSGSVIRLADAPARITVEGAGDFAHAGGSKPGAKSPQSVAAMWKTGMTFDDSTGVLTCNGDVSAEMHPDADTTDRVAANELQLTLTPNTGDKPASGKAAERTLLTAIATGTRASDGTARPVTVESRRYVPQVVNDSGERKLAQLFYLEGLRVEADNVAGTLHVPTPGQLLVLDRRDRPPAPTLNGDSPLARAASDSRGKALFSWTGLMDYQRSSGVLAMNENVNLTHERPDGILTTIDCVKLDSTILTTGGNSPESGQLLSAIASGGVVLRSRATTGAAQQLDAWKIDYDAPHGLAKASSLPGGLVVLTDSAQPAPVRAAALNWEIKTGRATIVSPEPVVAPVPGK